MGFLLLFLSVLLWMGLGVPEERLLEEDVDHPRELDSTTFDQYTVVDNYVDLSRYFRKSRARNDLVVFYTSLNVTHDPYFDLYAAWVNEMVAPDLFLVMNMVQIPSLQAGDRLRTTEEYFTLLARDIGPNVLVMVVTHGQIVMNYVLLNNILVANNRSPLNIFILNHEQPWVSDEESRRDNVILMNSMVSAVYGAMGLVLRNYYYEPIAADSVYVPLGPQKYRSIVGNSTHVIMQSIKPISQRQFRCLFAGRFLYIEDSFLHSERWEMKALIESGAMNCMIVWREEMNLKYTHTVDYSSYVDLTADTVFVPCPAGNNPETFRHYEALELGAIPLIVVGKADGETWTGKKEVQDRQNGRGENETKVRRGDINFLEYWEGYPGPLLESWEEAQSVMTALVSTPAVLDKLQRRLQNWYKSFKGLTRQRMALIIQGRMDINAQSERKTRRFEQTVIEV